MGIHSREDRDGILEAIRHFTEQYCSTITPTAPSLDDVKKPESPDCSSISSDTLRHDVASVTPASPSAPTISDIANSPTSGLQHSVLVNECVVCFEDQVRDISNKFVIFTNELTRIDIFLYDFIIVIIIFCFAVQHNLFVLWSYMLLR